ncbi:acetyl-CoA hydrolase/transferase family protein [Aureibacter tunicatorum]|uniref:Acyl-CoA hydrolase n=1 Tax=Aureibacter tunicatorum TaxID=866807 RepID=A0AAE4BSK5_9BACT|nr:acetyl-CoA hydrolase/transferase C-terminal domain-containing protein [Aureibacter tunicatorum]MDR6238918.1 acyl-CoA hydrolase [Aureibacter tunicatorum]BDD05155.1 4-hydroxybutyrate CoA-transferase [Aureibacter tunicatorum]
MKNKFVSAQEATSLIQSNSRVIIQGGAGTPMTLAQAMTERAEYLENVEIVHLHTEGPANYALPEYLNSFHTNAFFIGGNIRKYVNEGSATYIPIFLSDIPKLFSSGKMPIDTALIHVSPPDERGYCSLGVSIDIIKPALEVTKIVIAQVNPNMPRTYGDAIIHESMIDAMVNVEDPVYEMKINPPTEQEAQIGKNVASLIPDGATLQMGIGGIPNAVLGYMNNHKDLGIHTEMFSDGIIELVEKGIINGEKKNINRGKITSGFAMGTRKLYDFMDNNPMVEMMNIGYVNDTANIRKNDNVMAINSAIEVDITGQICADSIGTRMYSGVGGQMDFMRGAALSNGGKAITALPANTNKGISKIVPTLKEGAGVVTTRAHAQYVITEFGIAELHGKSLVQRAHALINVAHPEHRESLERAARERFGRIFGVYASASNTELV